MSLEFEYVHCKARLQQTMATAHALAPAQPTIFQKHESLNTQASSITISRPKDVLAEFNYHKDRADGQLRPPVYVTKHYTQMTSIKPKTILVRDIRGEEEKYTIDITGFQVLRYISEEKDFTDNTIIKRVYYPKIETLIKLI